jgi:hypothetical protein
MMTMKDITCDVCGRPSAIGVASTMLPYSCAYCLECAGRDAQPELVCESLPHPSQMHEGLADFVTTYKNGKYITYREWFNLVHPDNTSSDH